MKSRLVSSLPSDLRVTVSEFIGEWIYGPLWQKEVMDKCGDGFFLSVTPGLYQL